MCIRDSWNTGQILFNESEAGKMLRVNYYGMGSIIWASDTAKDTEWYRDYGNGDDCLLYTSPLPDCQRVAAI